MKRLLIKNKIVIIVNVHLRKLSEIKSKLSDHLTNYQKYHLILTKLYFKNIKIKSLLEIPDI